jgi:DNA primase
VNVPIEPRWGFTDVRRAALALARELERRMPDIATSAWWKEQRGPRVFVDYNQNARDRTVASAYSVRANPEGRVSCPLEWEEVLDADPNDLTIATVPARFAQRGDPAQGIDNRRHDLSSLLDLADRDQAEGLGDAPWPPHFAKQRGEPRRVAPSRARHDRS